MIQPRERPTRLPAPEHLRRSVRRRRLRNHYRRYVDAIRILGVLAIVMTLVMSYLALMANLTSLNYRVGVALEKRAALQEQTMRLDDKIAHLESRERLAEIAMKMGLHEPRIYAVVARTDAQPASTKLRRGGIALLGAMADWLKVP
jgi:cell division protein FtsL